MTTKKFGDVEYRNKTNRGYLRRKRSMAKPGLTHHRQVFYKNTSVLNLALTRHDKLVCWWNDLDDVYEVVGLRTDSVGSGSVYVALFIDSYDDPNPTMEHEDEIRLSRPMMSRFKERLDYYRRLQDIRGRTCPDAYKTKEARDAVRDHWLKHDYMSDRIHHNLGRRAKRLEELREQHPPEGNGSKRISG